MVNAQKKVMKTNKHNILTKSQNVARKFGFAVVLGGLLCMPVMAADNFGCDDENNSMINPELALCSVHAYNIGETENPSKEYRELMQNVIALKTTVITQQMNNQYEYMESMINRFKTQLEKAILTTKLRAAGAPAGDGNTSSGGNGGGNGGGYTSSNKNSGEYIDGAQNCAYAGSTKDIFECLRDNFAIIRTQYDNGNNITTELRRQLAHDYTTALDYKPEKAQCTETNQCKNPSGMQKSTFQTCMNHLNQCIVRSIDKLDEQDNRQQQNNNR